MSADTAPREWSGVGAEGLLLPLGGPNGPLASAGLLCHGAFFSSFSENCFLLSTTVSHIDSRNHCVSKNTGDRGMNYQRNERLQ